MLRFLLETLFELILCSLISFKMLQVSKIWNRQDTFAFVFAILVLVISTIFLAFTFYYVIFKQRVIAQAYKRRLQRFQKKKYIIYKKSLMLHSKNVH